MKKEYQNVLYLKTRKDGDWLVFHESQVAQSGVTSISNDSFYASPNFYLTAQTDGRKVLHALQDRGILCKFNLDQRKHLPSEIFKTFAPKPL